VLYNTYWVRFNQRTFTLADAVRNSRRLFDAARVAGVQRIVHVSITHASEDSDLEYFRGKALVERALLESGPSHAILRPAVLFGEDDILINNIAWMLRRLPIFGVFGDGSYGLQPVFVGDLARLAVEQGAATGDCVIDAIGPETFTFRGLVETIGRIIGRRRPIVSVSPAAGLLVGRLLGWAMRDVVITHDEIEGLMRGLLCTTSPPTGTTRFSDWARAHRRELGVRYTSELARRRDRLRAYDRL
jgi:NADH dehydrogenase